MTKQNQEGYVATTVICLAVAITEAAMIGYNLKKANSGYTEEVMNNVNELIQRYKKIKKHIPKEMADFYDDQLFGIKSKLSVSIGLKKLERGGLEIKV